jgi:TRAP-type uncharacterized transport system fused permease subunit
MRLMRWHCGLPRVAAAWRSRPPLGQLTPPVMGAAAFLMADVSGIPYGSIALAAVVPAVICYILMLQQATRFGRRIETAAMPEDATRTMQFAPPLTKAMLWHMAPFITIIAIMAGGERATAMAGLAGAAAAAGVGLILQGPRAFAARLGAALPQSLRAMSGLVLAGSALGVVVGALNITGLDVSLTLGLAKLGAHNLILSLALTGLAAIVLGAGLSTSGVYIVVATLLVPGLIGAGVEPIAAHMFVLYFGVASMITPPVAFAVMAACGISGASFTETAIWAMRFGWFLFVVPFLFVLFPGLLLAAEPVETAATICGAGALLLVGHWHARRGQRQRKQFRSDRGIGPE